MYNETKFLKEISTSFQKYIEFGPRSTEKLKPIHKFVAQTLIKIWGRNYKVHFMGENSKELKVKGKYYDKNLYMYLN
jgi:hypothetical protein